MDVKHAAVPILFVALAGEALDLNPDDRRFGEDVVRVGVGSLRAVMVHDPVQSESFLRGVLDEDRPAKADDALVARAPPARHRPLLDFPQKIHLETDPVVPPEDVELPPLGSAVEKEAILPETEIHRDDIGRRIVAKPDPTNERLLHDRPNR